MKMMKVLMISDAPTKKLSNKIAIWIVQILNMTPLHKTSTLCARQQQYLFQQQGINFLHDCYTLLLLLKIK